MPSTYACTRWCDARSTISVTGAASRRSREQEEARRRQAWQRAPLRLRDLCHRRRERGAGPDHVRPEPERVDRVAADVGVVVQPVDLVGDDPERDAREQEAVRGGAAAGADEELRERDEEQDVHRRVRHRDEPRAFGAEVPMVVGIDEEHPLHERDAAEDDHGVEDRRAARLAAELAQQHEDARARAADTTRDRRHRRSTATAARGRAGSRRRRRSRRPATWPSSPSANRFHGSRSPGGRLSVRRGRSRSPTPARRRRRRRTGRPAAAGSRRRSRRRRRR